MKRRRFVAFRRVATHPVSARDLRLGPRFPPPLDAIARMQGFWELHDFDHGSERTLGRFGSDVDVGSGVPRFVQNGMSRKTVLRYVQNVQRWIDSDGRWRP